MKITQQLVPFQPITIIIETKEEAEMLKSSTMSIASGLKFNRLPVKQKELLNRMLVAINNSDIKI